MTQKRSASQAGGAIAVNKRSRIANWDDRRDKILLGILKEQQSIGNGTSGSFPFGLWPTVVEAFNNKTGLSYGRDNLKNRLKVLKKIYLLYHAIVVKHGWEWDPVQNIPKPESLSEWNKIIASDPKFAKCKSRPFPQYTDLDFLCAGNFSNEKHGVSTNLDEDTSKDSMADCDHLGVTPKSGHNMNGTATSKNAEAQLDHCEADSMQPNSLPMSNPSPNPNPEDGKDFSEEEPSLSSSKQHFTFAVPLSSQQRPAHESDFLVNLATVEQRRLYVAQEKLSRVVALRPNVYSIEDCMKKLEKVEGVSPEDFVVACEGFKDQDSRTIFMNLDGPLLRAWIDRQVKVEMSRFGHQSLGTFHGLIPGSIPTPNLQQTPISVKASSGPIDPPPTT